MWIDFGVSVYQNGKCESITKYSPNIKNKDIKKEIWNFMAYKILCSIPLTIFMSFIVISLTYRTFISFIDYIFRNKSSLSNRHKSNESSRDSCLCPICNVNDDHEIIYSKFDLDYVLNLFNSKSYFNENNKDLTQIDLNDLNKKLKHSKIMSVKETKIRKLLNMIYKSDRNFRFTSRYINSVLVTCVALYYFVVFTGYIFIQGAANLHDTLSFIDKNVNKIQILSDYFSTEHQITFGEVCRILPDYLCIDSTIMNVTFTLPQIPKAVSFLNYTSSKLDRINFTSSFEIIIIFPIFGAFTICLVQMFLFIRESRLHLQQLYRGQCEFVVKSTSIPNGSIGINDFEFFL